MTSSQQHHHDTNPPSSSVSSIYQQTIAELHFPLIQYLGTAQQTIHLNQVKNPVSTMSSLTGQESSNTQPKNPVNPAEDTAGTFKGDSSVPFKTGSSTDPAGLSASMDKVCCTLFLFLFLFLPSYYLLNYFPRLFIRKVLR